MSPCGCIPVVAPDVALSCERNLCLRGLANTLTFLFVKQEIRRSWLSTVVCLAIAWTRLLPGYIDWQDVGSSGAGVKYCLLRSTALPDGVTGPMHPLLGLVVEAVGTLPVSQPGPDAVDSR